MDDQGQNVQDQNLIDEQAVTQLTNADDGAQTAAPAPQAPLNSGDPGSVVQPSDPVQPAAEEPAAQAAPTTTGETVIQPLSDQPAEEPVQPEVAAEPSGVVEAPEAAPQPEVPAVEEPSAEEAPPEVNATEQLAEEIEAPAPEVTEEVPAQDDGFGPLPDTPADTVPGDGDDEELRDLKQQALQNLTPLIKDLKQPPEQKFNTYMMIIRASDDKELLKPAYETAQEIPEDDKRAQALIDVVNEINYQTRSDEAE